MIIDKPDKSHIPALRSLWKEAFGDSEEFLDQFEATAFSVDRCRCVTVNGAVTAALYWFDCSYRHQRIAYLYAISTAKAYRGMGFCSALMEDTHRYLRALGYNGAILVPSNEELFDFYKRFGYRICNGISEIHCFASADEVQTRQIDEDEYARLRRMFLPRDGVVQENENLKFLRTQALFYAGEDFLLAARRENATLYGIELLGDIAAAPAILSALGYAEGRFRIQGEDRPFAMYRALTDESFDIPSYFGLAFD